MPALREAGKLDRALRVLARAAEVCDTAAACRIRSAAFSPITMHAAFVLPPTSIMNAKSSGSESRRGSIVGSWVCAAEADLATDLQVDERWPSHDPPSTLLRELRPC